MWITALLIGFAGSMHCLGMCSPLVMAVTSMRPRAMLQRVVYNSGRILTYGMMGALVAGGGAILPFREFQNVISITLGVALVIIGFAGVRRIKIPFVTDSVRIITTKLKGLFSHYVKTKTPVSMFVLGALNGLLPCGLSLIALSWCLTLKGPADGFNFMLIFGAGTLPVMLGITGMLPLLMKKYNWNIGKLTTSMIIVSGCVLIARVFIVHLPHAKESGGGLIDLVLCK